MPENQPKAGQFLAGTSKVDFPTPLAADQVLTDFIQSTAADYLELTTGTAALDFTKWPKHRLVKQVPISWNLVQRIYAADREPSEDTYNATPNFNADSNAHPIFQRDYLVRRWRYTPLAKGSILRGIVAANVLNEGSGYTQETVGVTLSGGMGSGGVLRAIVSNGKVVELAVLNQGNYSVAPTITITDSKNGTGATASCSVQISTAILTGEETQRLTDNPLDGLYILVRRTYEVLPGPWIPFTRYDDNLGPVQGRRRAVLSADGQDASLTPTGKTTYDARNGSSVVSWEVEESWSDGSGSPGNPLYPVKTWDDYDDLKGPVQTVGTLVLATGNEVGSLTYAAGIVTRITYEPFNQFLLECRAETFALPGPELITYGTDNETSADMTHRKQLVHVGTLIPAEGSLIGDQIVISAEYDAENAVYGTVKTVTMKLPTTRIEQVSRGFQFPAQFELLDVLWGIPRTPGYYTPGPYPGVHYTLSAHRSTTRPAICTYTYHNGPWPSNEPLDPVFTVTSPGAASRIFPINQNTIHDAIDIMEYDSDDTIPGGGLQIELLPASTPATYDPTDILVIEASERKWRGPIYERRICTVQETAAP